MACVVIDCGSYHYSHVGVVYVHVIINLLLLLLSRVDLSFIIQLRNYCISSRVVISCYQLYKLFPVTLEEYWVISLAPITQPSVASCLACM